MHRNARSAHQVWRKDIGGNEHILWKAYSVEGGIYAAIFNAGSTDSRIDIMLKDLEIPDGGICNELWSGLKAPINNKISVRIAPHSAKAFKIS